MVPPNLVDRPAQLTVRFSRSYDYGFARLSFMGSHTVTKMIFGPDNVEPLLGVTALESVGIGVDPLTQTLKRYAALPLKAQESGPATDHGPLTRPRARRVGGSR